MGGSRDSNPLSGADALRAAYASLDVALTMLEKGEARGEPLKSARQHLDRADLLLREATASADDQTDALERERRRLARDIHDGPAQLLTNLALRCEIVERLINANPPQALAEIQELRRETAGAVGELRDFIYELVPPGLAQRNLAGALREHCVRLARRFDFHVQLTVDDLPVLDTPRQLTIFRVVQEALQNVLRHSASREAFVRISTGELDVTTVISDRGCGFDLADPLLMDGKRLGLVGMRERAQALGGSLTVSSVPGQGTELILRLPTG